MGFTRYWEFSSLDEEKFKDFSSVCKVLIDSMNIPLEDIDEDGHETFYFSLDKSGFDFCKTNIKPYDEVVCGCLYIAKVIFGEDIRINQDCDSGDDEHIIKKVKSILRENKLNKILD